MMLGFKRQFAPFVREGSKTHTIRDRGKRRRFIPGQDVCDCYVDPRQSTMELLGRFPCVKVNALRIEVLPASGWTRIGGGLVLTAGVWVAGVQLDVDELGPLAWRDGFRKSGKGPEAFVEMCGFWKGRLPFDGDIIHWEWSAKLAGANVPRWKPARFVPGVGAL